MSGRLALALALMFPVGACNERGPVEELSPLLEGLGDPTRSPVGLSAELFRVLDESSQRALEARASAAEGVKLDGAALIQARGVGLGLRISKLEVLEKGAEKAKLRAFFESVSAVRPATRAMPLPPGAPVDFEAVREGGRWRLALPELARIVSPAGDAKGAR
jgi:hypothetical protein